MNLKSALFIFLAFLFTAYTLFTIQVESFTTSLEAIKSLKWGKLMLFDLYLGFLAFGSLVYLIEKSFKKAILWMLPSMILGNSVSILYVAFKFLKK